MNVTAQDSEFVMATVRHEIVYACIRAVVTVTGINTYAGCNLKIRVRLASLRPWQLTWKIKNFD